MSVLESLINSLTQFLEGNTDILYQDETYNPVLYHYLKEIIRYRNKLNFIILTTFGTVKIPPSL